MSSAPLYRVVACAVVLLMAPASASAEICGDADGSTTVTVTDGVQTLRAAASLSSSCTNARCDIDGNGSITVTDGVNVLRKAAALTIVENCPGVETEVEQLLRNTLPVFGALTKTSGAAAVQAAEAPCENADGTVTVDEQTNVVLFSNCDLGGIIFDGTIGGNADGSVAFDFEFSVIDTGESFGFDGDLAFTETSAGGLIIAGNLDISFAGLGDLPVVFEDITTDVDGNFVDGSLLFDASTSDIEGVDAIRVGFTSATVLPVEVILDDQSTLEFTFDINTNELKPVGT